MPLSPRSLTTRRVRAPRRAGADSLLLGLLLCAALHLLQIPLRRAVPQPALAYVGLTQWLYLGPVAWAIGKAGYCRVGRGVIIGGAAVSVLNVLAYGIIYYLFFVPKQ